MPDRGVYRVLDRHRLAVFTYPLNEVRVLGKRRATLHNGGIPPRIDIIHRGGPFKFSAHIRDLKGVGQTELAHIRQFPQPIVEHHIPGRGDLHQRRRIEVRALPGEKLPVQGGEVHQPAQRHIRVIAALLFIEGQLRVQQERNIVLLPDINDILKRGDLQLRWVGITGAVEGVIELEQVGAVFLFPKDESKQPVLILPICGNAVVCAHIHDSIPRFLPFNHYLHILLQIQSTNAGPDCQEAAESVPAQVSCRPSRISRSLFPLDARRHCHAQRIASAPSAHRLRCGNACSSRSLA